MTSHKQSPHLPPPTEELKMKVRRGRLMDASMLTAALAARIRFHRPDRNPPDGEKTTSRNTRPHLRPLGRIPSEKRATVATVSWLYSYKRSFSLPLSRNLERDAFVKLNPLKSLHFPTKWRAEGALKAAWSLLQSSASVVLCSGWQLLGWRSLRLFGCCSGSVAAQRSPLRQRLQSW